MKIEDDKDDQDDGDEDEGEDETGDYDFDDDEQDERNMLSPQPGRTNIHEHWGLDSLYQIQNYQGSKSQIHTVVMRCLTETSCNQRGISPKNDYCEVTFKSTKMVLPQPWGYPEPNLWPFTDEKIVRQLGESPFDTRLFFFTYRYTHIFPYAVRICICI